MSFERPFLIATLSLAVACSSDTHPSGTTDAGAGGHASSLDSGSGGASSGGTGTGGTSAGGAATGGMDAGSSGADAGVWTFPGSPGLPASPPWGPNILGLQNHDDSGSPSDIAFGMFWDPATVSVPYVGGGCMAFGTAPGKPGGLDVGPVTVTGGADSGVQLLTRDPHFGDYFLDGASNPWRVGDELSVTEGSVHAGPLEVPTAFTSSDLSTRTGFTRGTDAALTFAGSNATKVAFSVSASNGAQTFLLACQGDATGGQLTIPGAALAAFPTGVTSLDAKLSPINLAQSGTLAFLAVGESIEASLDLQ